MHKKSLEYEYEYDAVMAESPGLAAEPHGLKRSSPSSMRPASAQQPPAIATSASSQQFKEQAASSSAGSVPSEMKKARAVVSLITSDDFLMPTQALVASLRATGLQERILLIHTSSVSQAVLSRLSSDPLIETRLVEPIPNPHETDVAGWKNCGFTKLRIWEQMDFQKLVYIDADCIVLEDITDMFDRPSPSFCPDVFPPDKFNAGVIVLEPSKEEFARMMEQVDKLPSHDGGDTGFLNSFYSSWYEWPAEHRMPFRYNALRTLYWFTHKNPGYWNAVKPIKILHFCSSPKPWDAEAQKGDLEGIWWMHYIRSQILFV